MGEIVKCPINGSEKIIIICTEEQRENTVRWGALYLMGVLARAVVARNLVYWSGNIEFVV